MRSAALLRLAGLAACLCASASAQTGPRSNGDVSEPLRNAIIFYETGVWLEQPKIMGGTRAQPGADPWQVALLIDGPTDGPRRPFCGGSLIQAQWVVTAAHCVDRNTKPGHVDVLGGTNDHSKGGHRVDVDRIVVHPQWRPKPLRWNDIALLHLAEPLGSGALPIEVSAPHMEAKLIPPARLVRVTGWGAVGVGGDFVKDLRAVDVGIVSFEHCTDEVSYPGRISPSMVCAGHQLGAKDACQGDSGGPMTAVTGEHRYLAGVVSWGDKCGDPNKYGVYTRAAIFDGWIKRCVAGAPGCTGTN